MPGFLITSSAAQQYYYTAANVFSSGSYGLGRVGALFTSAGWAWMPGSGSGPIFGSGFPASRAYRIQAVRVRFNWGGGTNAQIADLEAAFQTLQVRFTNSVLTSGAQWDSTSTSTVTLGGEATGGGSAYVDITRHYRTLWSALTWGSVPGVEIRTADLLTGGTIIGTISLEIEAIVDAPDEGRAALGDATETFTVTIRPSTGTAAVGRTVSSRTRIPTSGTAVFGEATHEGYLFATKGLVALGESTRVLVNWPTRGRVAMGGATRDINRYVVPLRLKAAKVAADVGYMWVPVYLQLPIDPHVADWPWDFYYPDGRKIPFLIRNRTDRQVRALVYMRPSVTVAQDFFCRVG